MRNKAAHTIYFQTKTQRVRASIPDAALTDFFDFINESQFNIKIISPEIYYEGITPDTALLVDARINADGDNIKTEEYMIGKGTMKERLNGI
jgi:hypothetical protein